MSGGEFDAVFRAARHDEAQEGVRGRAGDGEAHAVAVAPERGADQGERGGRRRIRAEHGRMEIDQHEFRQNGLERRPGKIEHRERVALVGQRAGAAEGRGEAGGECRRICRLGDREPAARTGADENEAAAGDVTRTRGRKAPMAAAAAGGISPAFGRATIETIATTSIGRTTRPGAPSRMP